MNRNDTAIKGLAWLAATMPTLAQHDCLKGDEIVGLSAGAYDVTIHLDDYTTAQRIAARLDLPTRPNFGGTTSTQTWWIGYSDALEIRVVTTEPAPVPTECMDEVTA